jgi:hypothetical protein
MSNLQNELQEALESGAAKIIQEAADGRTLYEFSGIAVWSSNLRWTSGVGLHAVNSAGKGMQMLRGTNWWRAMQPQNSDINSEEIQAKIQAGQASIVEMMVEKEIARGRRSTYRHILETENEAEARRILTAIFKKKI